MEPKTGELFFENGVSSGQYLVPGHFYQMRFIADQQKQRLTIVLNGVSIVKDLPYEGTVEQLDVRAAGESSWFFFQKQND
jgi:hypothetical protein